jgi:hypothetical protein
MNTQKNAYEIRLEVLSIAHGDLMNIYHEKLHNRKKRMIEDGTWVEEKINEQEIADLLPTSEQIIDRAKELYTFVNGN